MFSDDKPFVLVQLVMMILKKFKRNLGVTGVGKSPQIFIAITDLAPMIWSLTNFNISS